jgi:23S rRNA pseudouridine1911/1915/1917 synthase
MAVVHAGRGKPAVTHYRMGEAFSGGKATLLELKLETGRTHQIRVHLAAVGCPLLGDDVYGGAEEGGTGAGSASKLRPAARRVPAAVRAAMGRQALHAKSLCFTHPATGERMCFEAPRPADFAVVVARLRGGGSGGGDKGRTKG